MYGPFLLAAALLFAPTDSAAVPQPPRAAQWRAEGLPDPVRADPADVARYFATLDSASQHALATRYPQLVGNLDGAPPALRTATNGGGRLVHDARGDGRIAEVVGDLGTADRIAVLVPGADTTAANFRTGLGGRIRRAPLWQARQLHAAAAAADPAARVAVVAWLGYDPPEGVRREALRADRAATGARALTGFVAGLLAHRPGASVVLIGHSYGSLVLGLAAPRLDPRVRDLVALGSPGMGVDRAARLRTTARVWAGTAPGDWIHWVPGVRVGGAGHGRKPTAPGFGARALPVAGVDGHDGYFVDGTGSLRALARIVTGAW